MDKHGCDLGEMIKSGNIGRVDRLEVALELIKLVKGMNAAKCFHRDLKPQNILAKFENGKWNWKLTDFALAEQTWNRRGICGTPGFAPIQIDGTYGYHNVDYPSLGLTVGFILMEKHTFWNSFFKSQENGRNKNNLKNHPKRYYKAVFEIIDGLMKGVSLTEINYLIYFIIKLIDWIWS